MAGLVAGLRRDDGLRPIDALRLREIGEFAFANALLALSIPPLTTLIGAVEPTVRLVAAVAGAYLLVNAVVLFVMAMSAL